jgi:hypothetical protein
MKEAIGNWMTMDILWLFTVPVDGQPAPPPTTPAPKPVWGRPVALPRVPVGHWAGDRVIIVDQDAGSASMNLPADLLARFPEADPEGDAVEFALENLKHVGLADYKPAEKLDANDALFPTDRVWVVRNLTKRWYARGDVLVKAEKLSGPAITAGVGLSDLVWAEIGGAMSCGSSHGERFDIQTLASIQNPEDGQQWIDKSKQAKSTLVSFDMNDDVSALRGEDEDY